MTMNQTIPTGTAAQLIERAAHAEFRSMVRWFCDKTGYFFTPNFRADLSPNRKGSWGGKRRGEAYVSLALHEFTVALETLKPHHFKEYPSYDRSPTIGGFKGHWGKGIAALVAHELVHAIQWYYEGDPRISKIFNITASYEKGHGDYFRQLYRAFREQFVNHREFSFEYILIPTKIAQQAEPAPKQKRGVKGIKMELSKTESGWFIHRYIDTATQKLLGTMASKPKYASQGLIDGKWVTLKDPTTGKHFKNHNEAKKFFLGL